MNHDPIQLHLHRRLVAAVVLQAIHDHQGRVKKIGYARAALEEPYCWLTSPETRPFTFRWCCSELGLEHSCQSLFARLSDHDIISKARLLLNTAEQLEEVEA